MATPGDGDDGDCGRGARIIIIVREKNKKGIIKKRKVSTVKMENEKRRIEREK